MSILRKQNVDVGWGPGAGDAESLSNGDGMQGYKTVVTAAHYGRI